MTDPIPDHEKAKSPELIEHERRLASGDREYLEHFLANSMKKGQRFCVTLVCEDPFASMELFKLIQPSFNKGTLAGCTVDTIYRGDIGAVLALARKNLAATLQSMG